MNDIAIQNLRKAFGGDPVFADLSLGCAAGRITALFGPNGCGKSTLLRIIAGLEKPDGGTITPDVRGDAGFSYVFQNYGETLLPWRDNFSNAIFPLQIRGIDAAEAGDHVKRLQEYFDFDFDHGGYPYNLSGGQQQMLVIIRALVSFPSLILMDEPFSALDYENGLRFRMGLQRYCREFSPTVLMVSHNLEEVVQLAARILVLTAKPAQVLADIANPLAYPRTIETLKTMEFNAVLEKVLSAFQSAANL